MATKATRCTAPRGSRSTSTQQEQLGSIEAGKIADLVVIRGDLAANPTVIREVTTVFKDGVGYDSPKILAAVKGRVGID